MNLNVLVVVSVLLSFVATVVATKFVFRFSAPSMKVLMITNIIAALVHGGLAVFMFFKKPTYAVGDRVECLLEGLSVDPIDDEEYAFVTIEEILDKDLVVSNPLLSPGENFTIPKSAVVDSWKVQVKTDDLKKPEFDDTDDTTAKLKKIQATLKPKPSLITLTSLTKSTAFFSALTSLAHMVPIIRNKQYNDTIGASLNTLRWVEYMITSGIMMVNIANVNDINSLYDTWSVFICTSITNAFGLAIEQTTSTLYKWVFMVLGFVPFALPWYMIVDRYLYLYRYFNENLLGSFDDDDIIFGEQTKKKLKETIDENLLYVGLATGVLFFLYFLFPAIQMCQIWHPDKYALGEFLFILASLFSKVWLNVGVYLLSNRPNVSKQYL